MVRKIFLIALIAFSCHYSFAQQNNKLFFTTGVGVIKVRHTLRDVLKPTVGFNSGLELINKQNWFLQGTLDFNTLKYDQKLKDENSPYLFRNTNSSLLMLGLNGGKNFKLSDNSFISTYIGGGYLSVGEPRVTIQNSVITQNLIRQGTIFGRGGTRYAFRSPIKFLQTLYIDANWWTAPIKVQGMQLNGFSFFITSRMAM
jgi:hypothetical protein